VLLPKQVVFANVLARLLANSVYAAVIVFPPCVVEYEVLPEVQPVKGKVCASIFKAQQTLVTSKM
jgi:hypothetical protein